MQSHGLGSHGKRGAKDSPGHLPRLRSEQHLLQHSLWPDCFSDSLWDESAFGAPLDSVLALASFSAARTLALLKRPKENSNETICDRVTASWACLWLALP
jgi:hypothetical protein